MEPGFKDMRDRTIGEIFDEMCIKHSQTGGVEGVVYLFRMRNPVTNEIMDLRVELMK